MSRDIVEVHGLADQQVAVGIESVAELAAVMIEILLDLELLPQPEAVAELGAVRDRAPEPFREHVVAAERHLRDHAGDYLVQPLGTAGTHLLSSLADCNGLIVLPEQLTDATVDESVAVTFLPTRA